MIYLQRIALILTIIGALNWGLVGIAGLDLVALLFGPYLKPDRLYSDRCFCRTDVLGSSVYLP